MEAISARSRRNTPMSVAGREPARSIKQARVLDLIPEMHQSKGTTPVMSNWDALGPTAFLGRTGHGAQEEAVGLVAESTIGNLVQLMLL